MKEQEGKGSPHKDLSEQEFDEIIGKDYVNALRCARYWADGNQDKANEVWMHWAYSAFPSFLATSEARRQSEKILGALNFNINVLKMDILRYQETKPTNYFYHLTNLFGTTFDYLSQIYAGASQIYACINTKYFLSAYYYCMASFNKPQGFSYLEDIFKELKQNKKFKNTFSTFIYGLSILAALKDEEGNSFFPDRHCLNEGPEAGQNKLLVLLLKKPGFIERFVTDLPKISGDCRLVRLALDYFVLTCKKVGKPLTFPQVKNNIYLHAAYLRDLSNQIKRDKNIPVVPLELRVLTHPFKIVSSQEITSLPALPAEEKLELEEFKKIIVEPGVKSFDCKSTEMEKLEHFIVEFKEINDKRWDQDSIAKAERAFIKQFHPSTLAAYQEMMAEQLTFIITGARSVAGGVTQMSTSYKEHVINGTSGLVNALPMVGPTAKLVVDIVTQPILLEQTIVRRREYTKVARVFGVGFQSPLFIERLARKAAIAQKNLILAEKSEIKFESTYWEKAVDFYQSFRDGITTQYTTLMEGYESLSRGGKLGNLATWKIVHAIQSGKLNAFLELGSQEEQLDKILAALLQIITDDESYIYVPPSPVSENQLRQIPDKTPAKLIIKLGINADKTLSIAAPLSVPAQSPTELTLQPG